MEVLCKKWEEVLIKQKYSQLHLINTLSGLHVPQTKAQFTYLQWLRVIKGSNWVMKMQKKKKFNISNRPLNNRLMSHSKKAKSQRIINTRKHISLICIDCLSWRKFYLNTSMENGVMLNSEFKIARLSALSLKMVAPWLQLPLMAITT